MKFLLDTNVLVEILRGRSMGVAFRNRLDSLTPGDAVVCSVVREELMFGACRSRQPEERVAHMTLFLSEFQSLPFSDAAADRAARIRSGLSAQGAPIGPHDVQIAAIVLTNGLTLVTHNSAEFSRVSGLVIEDWQTS